jgi:carbon monoxide dehydrogenase subunit G
VLSQVRLEPLDDGKTRLHWNATTGMKGIVARVGGSRLEGLARELTQRFWDRFIARVEASV